MINRLPLTVGFARVSQATEDQGNLETQTQQLQGYGVHEVVTETGSGARSDRRALRDLQARLHAGDAPLELPHRNVGMGSAVGENRGIDGPPPGGRNGPVAGCPCAHREAPPPWSQNGAPGPPKMGPRTLKTAEHKSYTGLRLI